MAPYCALASANRVAEELRSLNLSESEKALYQEEVLNHSGFFSEMDGTSLRDYGKFSAEWVLTSSDEVKGPVALCYQISVPAEACPSCDSLKENLERQLKKRFQRRGFDLQPLPAEVSTGVRKFDVFLDVAEKSGCLHSLLVNLSPSLTVKGSMNVESYLDLRDRGKTHHRSHSHLVLSDPDLLTSALVQTCRDLMTPLGAELSREKAREASDEKMIRLERAFNYASYMEFKQKVADSIEGVAGIQERVFQRGCIDFLVSGSISLQSLSQKLKGMQGTNWSVDTLQIDDGVLKVVLK